MNKKLPQKLLCNKLSMSLFRKLRFPSEYSPYAELYFEDVFWGNQTLAIRRSWINSENINLEYFNKEAEKQVSCSANSRWIVVLLEIKISNKIFYCSNKKLSTPCEWFIDNRLSINFREDKTKYILKLNRQS